jgi:ubiquinone biosynthesis protein COQ9
MKEKVFKACLMVIEKEGWKGFSFAKASQESGIPLHTFHNHFPSPTDVMLHLFRKIDNELLKNLDLSDNVSPKDALFEVLMARFDAAQPYKAILKSFWSEWVLAPEEAPALAHAGFTSMMWVLEAAGLENRGLKGMLHLQGLTTLYLLTLKTWLKDDSPELGKTMAFLDKGLSRLEKLANMMNAL